MTKKEIKNMAFDECPAANLDKSIISKSVDRTFKWTEKCYKYLKENDPIYSWNQTLFPIIQGGTFKSERRKSAELLIPFADCGVAIGGLAVGEDKSSMFDTIALLDESTFSPCLTSLILFTTKRSFPS
mgnify:CR=1 FL=1